VGANADFLVPEFWRANDSEDLKLIDALSTPGALADVARAFPDFYRSMAPPADRGVEIATDTAISDIACFAISSRHPNLLLAHFWDVDDQQHEHGLFSPRAKFTIEKADRQIARLAEAARKSGTWEKTVLVVVSDHGFADVHHSIRPGVLLTQHHLVTLNEKGHISSW
jgi:predicted AlkP superfamily pyrophosphatase or phosphodiesterase